MSKSNLPKDGWLALLDIEAVANLDDKLGECEFLFRLMTAELDRDKFRWLTSAFLNAAYSFFESSALMAFLRFTDANGEPRPDYQALEVLGTYVKVARGGRKRDFVKTTPLHPLTAQLYEFRRKSTVSVWAWHIDLIARFADHRGHGELDDDDLHSGGGPMGPLGAHDHRCKIDSAVDQAHWPGLVLSQRCAIDEAATPGFGCSAGSAAG
jgi:hypothetical protein